MPMNVASFLWPELVADPGAVRVGFHPAERFAFSCSQGSKVMTVACDRAGDPYLWVMQPNPPERPDPESHVMICFEKKKIGMGVPDGYAYVSTCNLSFPDRVVHFFERLP